MVLVDCDPDGLNIFRCYRYGSGTSPSIYNAGVQWLGIKTRHVLELGKAAPILQFPMIKSAQDSQSSHSSNTRTAISSTACRDPISQLSTRDRKLAVGTIERLEALVTEDEQAAELKRELKTMLILGVKTEIQWLDDSGSIVEWLDHEIGAVLGFEER